ncbi:MAG: hypothetical protein EOO54_18020, partial [Haliea sp.]
MAPRVASTTMSSMDWSACRPNVPWCHPVMAADVLFSRELLQTRGRPNHRLFYSKVTRAEALDPRTVRFEFGGQSDRELPLILGLMPILPKHATDPGNFEETSMTSPVGSGPYRIT